MTTRWLVTGAAGQLGSHLVRRLAGQDLVALARSDLDITSADAVEAVIRDSRPDVVLNAAAYTSVDAAEEDEAGAFAVNEFGPRLLAESLARHGGRLVHISTDYVFDGTADRPYEPGDRPAPRTVYGRSKLAGERAAQEALPGCHIVRTAWVYGGPGRNFVDTVIDLEHHRKVIDVVDDQIGSPTWAQDLADALVRLGGAGGPAGVLHFVNTGRTSWFGLAREVFRLLGADPDRVSPVPSSRFPRPAARPSWSVLSPQSWTNRGFSPPRSWQAALRDHLRSRPG